MQECVGRGLHAPAPVRPPALPKAVQTRWRGARLWKPAAHRCVCGRGRRGGALSHQGRRGPQATEEMGDGIWFFHICVGLTNSTPDSVMGPRIIFLAE